MDVSTQNPLSGRPRLIKATIGTHMMRWTVGPKVDRTLRLLVPRGPFTVNFTLSPVEVAGPYDPRRHTLQVGTITFPGS